LAEHGKRETGRGRIRLANLLDVIGLHECLHVTWRERGRDEWEHVPVLVESNRILQFHPLGNESTDSCAIFTVVSKQTCV
jgi:hypothetical protein